MRNRLRGESGGECGDDDPEPKSEPDEGDWDTWAGLNVGFDVGGVVVVVVAEAAGVGFDAMDVAGTSCLRRLGLLSGADGGGGEDGSEDESDGVQEESRSTGLDDGAGVGTGVPKGVSSSFTLEEDATWLVAGMRVGLGCMAERARWLRVCCDDRWADGGTARNWSEADMPVDGAGVAMVAAFV